MEQKRVAIFEARNETLKEIYVGLTTGALHAVTTALRSACPDEIKHWQATDEITCGCVDASLAPSHAAEFAADHARSISMPGWKVIVGAEAIGRKW